MSSETSFFGEGNPAGPLLTQYHLVDPETAYGNIIGSITSGEVITLLAKASAGIGRTSVEASFTDLRRIDEADGLFGSDDSPQLEARGVTKHPNSLYSDDGDKRPLTVVLRQSDGNDGNIDSGHFFLETKQYP
jgi:hypothetical protein